MWLPYLEKVYALCLLSAEEFADIENENMQDLFEIIKCKIIEISTHPTDHIASFTAKEWKLLRAQSSTLIWNGTDPNLLRVLHQKAVAIRRERTIDQSENQSELIQGSISEEFSSESPENFKALKDENLRLKRSINELSGKFQQLEEKSKEFKRLILEQSSMMKALCAACFISSVLLLVNRIK